MCEDALPRIATETNTVSTYLHVRVHSSSFEFFLLNDRPMVA